MNYSLDALWWRLTDPGVRALASVLTAPVLWHSGAELGVRELLGGKGFRYLLDLDGNPESLRHYLQARCPFGNRLGWYAESLLAFWLETAPHTRLLAQNAVVQNAQGQTAGAADFIALVNGQPCHIELTCKYYGSRSGRPSEMIGLNRHDRLADKAAKLAQQTALLQTEAGQGVLRGLGLQPQQVCAVTVVRGIAFSAAPPAAENAPLNPYGWHGLYIEDWAEYDFSDGLKRYYALPRMDFLAPARIAGNETQGADDIRNLESGLIAELEHRPDGCWHEVKRLMKVQRPGGRSM
ncbi:MULTISPECIES: DUF1853 family protein [unclassified Neisseria]|uniref:DUF1853 family protein n=1 Tax=unclassified Neisseria TaxID=2623750 RepID=UPI001071DA0E|nr:MULTISPECIES: DUF1853 family protein [unclassified Neisseria]MBF0802959.1 DUF1853 family protein [Neisseria sp. 19428wB4_WF04]TFU44486.1 DUF1853 family protein [Neisseria sp. WF04]